MGIALGDVSCGKNMVGVWMFLTRCGQPLRFAVFCRMTITEFCRNINWLSRIKTPFFPPTLGKWWPQGWEIRDFSSLFTVLKKPPNWAVGSNFVNWLLFGLDLVKHTSLFFLNMFFSFTACFTWLFFTAISPFNLGKSSKFTLDFHRS